MALAKASFFHVNAFSPSSRSHAVNFANESMLFLFDSPNRDDIDAAWYSEEERHSFKLQLRADAQRMTTALTRSDRGPATEDDLVQCLGMERFLSISILRETLTHRRAHYDAVFGEQDRQRMCGTKDEDALRISCESHSCWARDRATRLGTVYSLMKSV